MPKESHFSSNFLLYGILTIIAVYIQYYIRLKLLPIHRTDTLSFILVYICSICRSTHIMYTHTKKEQKYLIKSVYTVTKETEYFYTREAP